MKVKKSTKKTGKKKTTKRRRSSGYGMSDMIRVQKMNGTYNTPLGAVARQIMREAGLK